MKNPRFVGLKFPEIARPEGLERRYLGKLNKVALDFMNRLLKMDTRERMTAVDALNHPYFNGLRPEPVDRPLTSSMIPRDVRGRVFGSNFTNHAAPFNNKPRIVHRPS